VLSLLPDLSPLAAIVPAIPVWDQYVRLLQEVLDFLAATLHSAGLAVIVFTIIIKTLLLPLTVQSIRSSKAMQELQPKIKELQKKHGKDRQRISQETMALYQAHRVNPMSGCLPMLIQMPIFFGVYRAIANMSDGKVAEVSIYWSGGFLWLDSLASPDPLHVLPIMAGAFQFVQTKMMRPQGMGKPTDPQQAMMNTMMNFMPLMVVFFGWGFAAGPVLYWVTQSVYSVVQQWFITGWGSMKDWAPFLPDLPEHKRLGYRPPRDLDDIVVVTGADGQPAKPKGFMGWMQAKAEEAQAQQRAKTATGATASNAPPSASGTSTNGSKPKVKVKAPSTAPIDVEPEEPARPAGKAPRPVKKGSTKKSGGAAAGN
jgi:YidC/Oxa1 family membrane protein insertase